MCGVNEIFGCIKIVISGFGSLSKTSKPAKATFPESKAFIKATSSITPPRAQFTIPPPSFKISNYFSPMIYPSCAGTGNVIKSASLNKDSND